MRKEIDALERLKALVKQRGSQKAVAAELGCSPAHVGDLLKGHRTFSDAMLAKLGLKREIVEAK